MNEHLVAFRQQVCERAKEVDTSEALDWFALSFGFFLARGVSIEEAWQLSLDARYKHEYWR
jgi:hypothetical protein